MITCNILFSGIGAQEAAFKRLGLDFEVVGISEIDKYAIQSYEAINGPTRNYGDITQIERLDYADLWTYSFPCQSLSQASKQEGFYKADGSLTRSGLLKHVERLLTESVLFGTQPKYLLLENVKALVSKKFKPDFLKWLNKLEQLGYNNYWQVLNAKDYGIPQNRERVFVVSIRKDIDTKGYKFPSPVPLEKRLKDMLEPCVDEKYYLSADKVAKFLQNSNTNPSGKGINGNVCTRDICNTLTTNKEEGLKVVEPLCATSRGRNPDNPSDRTIGSPTEQRLEINYSGCTNTLTSVQKDNYVVEPKVIQVGNIVNTGNWDNPQRGRIYSSDGCSPALNCVGGGGLEPKILEQLGGAGLNIDDPFWDITEESVEEYINSFKDSNELTKVSPYGFRIRKLTPRECWRLMGFTDIEFECAKLSGVSNSQLYRQAGNSIVVDVLVAIFKELFDDRF